MKCPGCGQDVPLVMNAIFQRHRKPNVYICEWSGKMTPEPPPAHESSPIDLAALKRLSKKK
jgi:hypothetical protein